MREVPVLTPFLLPLLGLVVTFGLGWLAAMRMARLETARGMIDKREGSLVADGAQGVLGFVGGASAFLIGVLMLASVDHFNATSEVANDEAIAYSAAFQNSVALPDPARQIVQRDLVCLMRSVATDSWNAATTGDLTGDRNSNAWRAKTVSDFGTIALASGGSSDALDAVASEVRDAAKFGQHRLLAGESTLPLAMWALLYLSLLVLTFLMTLMMRSYPLLLALCLGATFIVSAGMISVLVAFAEPFDTDTGVYISPRALESVLITAQESQPGAVWDSCERLSP
jgi:hypothetical protein